jgi:hypothetical protein
MPKGKGKLQPIACMQTTILKRGWSEEIDVAGSLAPLTSRPRPCGFKGAAFLRSCL